jgi:iron complex transport system permease protein
MYDRPPPAAAPAAGETPVRPKPAPRSRRASGLAVGLAALLLLLLLAVAASLCVGSGGVRLPDVWHAVFDFDPNVRGQLVVNQVRIPRTCAGLLAGVALGPAGAVMQAVTRNPLADPGLLGVNAGASVSVVFAIGVIGLTTPSQYIWFGFLGALLASALVYSVGSLGRGGATPVKLALAGSATTAALTSLTTSMLVTNNDTFEQYRFWQVGSLADRDPSVLWQALPFILLGSAFALLLGPRLNAMALGDDLARGLGQRVGRARLASAAAVVLLCGAATVVAGPIAFVGLIVPHGVRLFTGPDQRWILPYSAVVAPVLLLLADVLGRLIARPGEVQVGVMTAAVGAIPFVLLVRRGKGVRL